MAQKILLKKSSVSNKVPVASGLSFGEITINYASGTDANNFIAARRADDATGSPASILIYDKKYNDKTYSKTGHTHDDRYYTESEINTKLAGKSDTGHTHTKSDITDFPTIPTVGNGKITIKQAGTEKGSFTVNQTGATTIELTDTTPTVGNGKITIKQAGTEKGSFTVNQTGATTIELTDTTPTVPITGAVSGTNTKVTISNKNVIFSAIGVAVSATANTAVTDLALRSDVKTLSGTVTGLTGTVGNALTAITTGNSYLAVGAASGHKQAISAVTGTVSSVTSTGMLADAYDVQLELKKKSDTRHTHTKSDITDFPTIPTVPVTSVTGDNTFITATTTNSAVTIKAITGTVENSGNTLAIAGDVKGYVNTKLSAVYKYQGSCTYAELTAKTGMANGDVWNVTDEHNNVPAGTNYAYVLSTKTWDALAGTVDLTKYSKTGHTHTKSEITDFPTIPTVPITGAVSGTNTKVAISNKNVIFSAIGVAVSATANTAETDLALRSDVKTLSGTVTGLTGTVGNALIAITTGNSYLAVGTASGHKQAISAVTGTVSSVTGTGKLADAYDVQLELKKKSDTGHNHDSVYSKTGHTHDDRYYTESEINTKLAGKSDTGHNHDSVYSKTGHTHSYAGSSSAGGAATSANKLNTDAGSATQPVYFKNGVPSACTYTLGASVPSDAKFTDTTYSTGTSGAAGLAKLFAETGTATDGAINQSAMTTLLNGKADKTEVAFEITSNDSDNVYLFGSKLTEGYSTAQTSYQSTSIPWNFDYKVWMRGGNLYAASDGRLKIFDEENEVFDWNKFEQIPVKYYRWKDKPFGKAQIGTCAQTISDIYPELVTQHNDGTLGVAYDRLALISVEGVKKLRQEIEEKERENTELKATVSALTEDLEDLVYTARTFTLTTTGEGDATISMERRTPTNGSGMTVRIDYSYDNLKWVKNWDFSPITLKNGESLYLRGRCPKGTANSMIDYLKFVFSGTSTNTKIVANGYLYKLIGSGYEMITDLNKYDGTNSASFQYLFSGCTMLSEANLKLCATGLSPRAYDGLFKGCTALTSTTEMTILSPGVSCAQEMYLGCSSITDASNITISATTYEGSAFKSGFTDCSSLEIGPSLYCDGGELENQACAAMFQGCSSLNKVGGSINIDRIAEQACKYMFAGCKKLAESIPITVKHVGYEGCSHMFSSCQSLVNAPQLSCEDGGQGAFEYMFMNCSSLKTTPQIFDLYETDKQFEGMYAECTSLEEGPSIYFTGITSSAVKCMFRTCNNLKSVNLVNAWKIEKNIANSNWFQSNTGTGVLYYFKITTSEYLDYLKSSLPSGWTVEFNSNLALDPHVV